MIDSLIRLDESLNRLEDSFFGRIKKTISPPPKPGDITRLFEAMKRIDPNATLKSATVTFKFSKFIGEITLKANGQCYMEWGRNGFSLFDKIETAEAYINMRISA